MEIKNLEEYYKLVRSLKVEIQRLTAMLDAAEEYLFPFPLKNVSDIDSLVEEKLGDNNVV